MNPTNTSGIHSLSGIQFEAKSKVSAAPTSPLDDKTADLALGILGELSLAQDHDISFLSEKSVSQLQTSPEVPVDPLFGMEDPLGIDFGEVSIAQESLVSSQDSPIAHQATLTGNLESISTNGVIAWKEVSFGEIRDEKIKNSVLERGNPGRILDLSRERARQAELEFIMNTKPVEGTGGETLFFLVNHQQGGAIRPTELENPDELTFVSEQSQNSGSRIEHVLRSWEGVGFVYSQWENDVKKAEVLSLTEAGTIEINGEVCSFLINTLLKQLVLPTSLSKAESALKAVQEQLRQQGHNIDEYSLVFADQEKIAAFAKELEEFTPWFAGFLEEQLARHQAELQEEAKRKDESTAVFSNARRQQQISPQMSSNTEEIDYRRVSLTDSLRFSSIAALKLRDKTKFRYREELDAYETKRAKVEEEKALIEKAKRIEKSRIHQDLINYEVVNSEIRRKTQLKHRQV